MTDSQKVLSAAIVGALVTAGAAYATSFFGLIKKMQDDSQLEFIENHMKITMEATTQGADKAGHAICTAGHLIGGTCLLKGADGLPNSGIGPTFDPQINPTSMACHPALANGQTGQGFAICLSIR